MPIGVPYSATEENRRLVKAMAGYGVPHEGIATLLEIDPKTLRRHYRKELDRGSVEATAKVAQSLFQMATVDKNVAAAIFWMKARAGWREKPDPNAIAIDAGSGLVVTYQWADESEGEEAVPVLAGEVDGERDPGW
jgi:hypothetical protein